MSEESHVFEGKTTNEAIEKGLKELNIKREQAEIKVLENNDKRSFFSILAPRVVKVEIRIKEDKNNDSNNKEEKSKEVEEINKNEMEKSKRNIEEFLNEWVKVLPSGDINFKIEDKKNYIIVEFIGNDLNYLIGYRGEVLNSIQTILSQIACKDVKEKVKVLLDLDNYRKKRKVALEDLAEKVAKTVLKKGKSIKLEPMSSYERKIIHSKLQENDKVKTISVGEEPYRRIIISKK